MPTQDRPKESPRTLVPKDPFYYRLLGGVFVITLLVASLVALFLTNSRHQYEHLAGIWTQNIAKVLEVNISGAFDKIDIGLLDIAHEAERQLAQGGIRPKELNAAIQKQHAQLTELYGRRVTDAEGNMRYGTDIPTGEPVIIRDRDYFERLRFNPNAGLVTSGLIQGKVSKKWNITLARRVNRPDGTFAGVAFANFSVDYFDDLFSRLDIGAQDAIGIRDQDFRLVALHPRGPEPGSQIGSQVVSQKTRDMIGNHPVTATYNTVFARDDKERTVTFRKIGRYPFYVFATSAPGDYLAPWKREAAIAGALFTAFVVVTLLMSRGILRTRAIEQARFEAVRLTEDMRLQNKALTEALSRVKRLEGFISICSYCKKVRTEQQSWEQLETYISENSDAMFSHGACPECARAQMEEYKAQKPK